MLLLSTLGKPITTLFTNDHTLFSPIMWMLYIAALSLPFINLHQSISSALRSAGDSVAPLVRP